METDEDLKTIRRWFSIGDILTAIAMLAALAASYGSLSARLDGMARDIQEMQERDITPGARTEIAGLQAKDIAQDAQIQELRESLREQRREILESLARVESKLERHDQR